MNLNDLIFISVIGVIIILGVYALFNNPHVSISIVTCLAAVILTFIQVFKDFNNSEDFIQKKSFVFYLIMSLSLIGIIGQLTGAY